jgi:ABC-2 type transport system ATP-binding protein
LSTHLIADVNQCCVRVAILHRGRLRYDGPVQMLSHDPVFEVRVSKTPAQDAWAAIAGVESAQFADGFWQVKLKPDARPETLAESIVRHGWGLLELRAQQTNLEQVFLRIASADDTAVAA